jgi:hypothetical protein
LFYCLSLLGCSTNWPQQYMNKEYLLKLILTTSHLLFVLALYKRFRASSAFVKHPSLTSAAQQSVTKTIASVNMNLVTLCCTT